MNQMSELFDKDFKGAVIKILHQLQIALKKVKENHHKEIEVVKNN